MSKKVKEENADLGIAHDGDADRAIIVGEDGQFFSLDVQLCMMIQHELDLHKEIKNKKIITTVESSLIVRETIEKNNAQSLVTPVGSLYIAELLEKENALFGGEPCGEYLFKDGVICPDGVLTAAKFVELFSQKGSLNSLAKEYTTYPILREKFKCENSKKYGKVEEIKSKIQSQYKKVNTEDGIRVDEEHGWFLIRASGTEPIIRLTMEYKSKDKLEKMSKSVSSLILSMVN